MPYSVCGSVTSTIVRAELFVFRDRFVDRRFNLRVDSFGQGVFLGDADAEAFDAVVDVCQIIRHSFGDAGGILRIVRRR